ncbi:MAG: polysaccharide deacetylase family protein [bacterium]|nr:polysaccharide deacetylase family protein [bacterium]
MQLRRYLVPLALVLISGLGGFYLHAAVGTKDIADRLAPVTTTLTAPAVSVLAAAPAVQAIPTVAVPSVAPAVQTAPAVQPAFIVQAVPPRTVAGAAAPTVAGADAPTTASIPPAGVDVLAAYRGKVFSHGASGSRLIALTFDDGPYPNTTPQLLEVLKSKGVKATFFMLGSEAAASPAVARRVADAGFEIGCHTYSHLDLHRMSSAAMRAEIEKGCRAIEQAAGRRPVLLRPPYGNTNAAVRQVCGDLGLVIVNWSIDPTDWNVKVSSESILKKVISQAHGGGIVCMHDTRRNTIKALPDIIDDLRAKGFTFVTVSELIADHARSGAKAGEEALPSTNPPEMNQPLVIPLNESAAPKKP